MLEEQAEALEQPDAVQEAAELWLPAMLLVMLPELLLQAEEKGDTEELREARLLEAEALLNELALMEGVAVVLLPGLEREAEADTEVVKVPDPEVLTEAQPELEGQPDPEALTEAQPELEWELL